MATRRPADDEDEDDRPRRRPRPRRRALPFVLLGGAAALLVVAGAVVAVLALSKSRRGTDPATRAAGKPGGGPGAELVVNGSFEDGPEPDPAGPGFTPLEAGSTAVPGWTVTRGSVDYVGPYWQHADGRRSLDLNGNEPGAVAQTLRTRPGATYRVTFRMAGNNCPGGPGVKTLVVSAAGRRGEFTFDATARTYEDMGWVTRTWEFTAAAAETTLEFASTTAEPAACGPALDRVSVMEVRR